MYNEWKIKINNGKIMAEERDRVIKTIVRNRKVTHDFIVLQKFEAGIVLQGTEVKSLRQGKCTISDAYAGFPSKDSMELHLFNLHIAEYSHGTIANHQPKRDRKLLLKYRELNKIKTQLQEKGLTIVPMALYFSGHLVKVELGLVKAKKNYDKRESEKEKVASREISRKFRI